VIFWPLPYHWDTKSECFLFSFRPLPQILYTNITYLVWSPLLILISQLHAKIVVVHFSNEARNISLMFFNHKIVTDITKTFWRVHTTTTWHVQSTSQYKIKLKLRNETALTASLEHEEVLNHRLLNFFYIAKLVQKISTKSANSLYPSYMKKTPSVVMYIVLKIVTLLSYFIFVYGMNCAWLYSMKIWFCEKWHVIGQCHFIFQYTKLHEEELSFSVFFSRKPV
jgi:hypothetical protein